MAKIIQFPDGTRLTDLNLTFWSASSSVVSVGLNGTNSSGSYTYGAYTYTAPNDDVAAAIVKILDYWQTSPVDINYMNVSAALGVAIFTITPNSGTAASSFAIDLTGQQFTEQSTITIGGVVFPVTTFTDSANIEITYAGQLVAGTYDVIVQNPTGNPFAFTQSLTLS